MPDEGSITASGQRVDEEHIASLRQRIRDGEREVKRLQAEASSSAEIQYKEEIDELRASAQKVIVWLVVAVGVTAAVSVCLLVSDRWGSGEWRNCLACLAASVLGSSTSALISALGRRAGGWETHGIKIPPGEGERFNEKMAPFLATRPVLGCLTGLLVFSACRAHFLIKGDSSNSANPTSLSELVFYSLLAGLFAKTLIEKLKALFDKLFGG
jgi:hypothetical protein